MIFNFFISVALGFLNTALSWINTMGNCSGAFTTTMGNATTIIGNQLSTWNSVLHPFFPITLFLWIVTVMITLEGFIYSFKFFMWIIHMISLKIIPRL
jgi:hypothetical protein